MNANKTSEKTIRMPADLLAKWLAALRSGEYKQARRRLEVDGAYCCLGVLQVVADGDVERTRGVAAQVPSDDWLDDNGIWFFNNMREPDCQPYLPAMGRHAAAANDDGATFAEIADAIEACAEANDREPQP